jgi:hypothetical protein
MCLCLRFEVCLFRARALLFSSSPAAPPSPPPPLSCVVLHRAVGRSAFLLTLVHLALMWLDYGLADLLSARPNCFGTI